MKRNGQSIAEYALMVGVVSAAFIAMAMLVQSSVKSNVNVMERQFISKARTTPPPPTTVHPPPPPPPPTTLPSAHN